MLELTEFGKLLDNPFWVGKNDSFQLKVAPWATLEFTAQSGDERLYEYFPWILSVYVDGEREAIIEFSEAQQDHQVRIDLASSKTDHVLTLVSELGGVPAQRGINDDQRELSAYIFNLHIQPCVQDETLSGSGAPSIRRHLDKLSSPAPKHDSHPIFVIGSYRAGTSVSTWTIGQHPNVFPLDETNWLPPLYFGARAAYRVAAAPTKAATDIYDLSRQEFLEWQGEAIHRLHRTISLDRATKTHLQRIAGLASEFHPAFQIASGRYNAKTRWVDGTPENTGIAIGLAEMFPQAKFIYCLRRPQPVIGSLMNFDRIGGPSRSFEESADIWERMNGWACEALHKLGPDRVFLSAFEDLTDRPTDLARRWWRFLGEPIFYSKHNTLETRINSSAMRAEDDPVMDASVLEQLNRIHDQIIEGRAFAEIDWRMPVDTFEERSNHIVSAMLRQLQ